MRMRIRRRHIWIASGSLLLVSLYAAARSNGYLRTTPGEAVPIMAENTHIPTRYAPHVPYNSTPPTSGQHVPQTVTPGVYREEIPEEIQVHVLEHGHVMLQYAPSLPADQVKELERIGRSNARDVVVAPYGRLASGVALTAWGRLERLSGVDQGAIVEFIRAYRGCYDHGWTGACP